MAEVTDRERPSGDPRPAAEPAAGPSDDDGVLDRLAALEAIVAAAREEGGPVAQVPAPRTEPLPADAVPPQRTPPRTRRTPRSA